MPRSSAPGSPRDRAAQVADPSPTATRRSCVQAAFSLNLGELRRLGWETDGWRPGYDMAGVIVAAATDGSGPPVGAHA